MSEERRNVIAYHPDPDDPKRRIYRLECGHSVSRRTSSRKTWAICGEC